MVPFLLLFTLMIGEIQAGSYSENLQETPPELKHEKGCYVDRIKEVIPFEGFSVLPRECMRIDCNVTQITYNTCDVEELPSELNCKFEGDPNEFFPKCCPKVKCLEEEDLNDAV